MAYKQDSLICWHRLDQTTDWTLQAWCAFNLYASRRLWVSSWESTNVPSAVVPCAVHVSIVKFFVRVLTPGSCTEKQTHLFISHTPALVVPGAESLPESDCVSGTIDKPPELNSFPLMSDQGNWCWRVGSQEGLSSSSSSSSFPHFIIFIRKCFFIYFFLSMWWVHKKKNIPITVIWWFVGVKSEEVKTPAVV